MQPFRERMPQVLQNLEWNRRRKEIIASPETSIQMAIKLAQKYPHRFYKDDVLMSQLLKYLEEGKFLTDVGNTFCLLADKFSYTAVWNDKIVLALKTLLEANGTWPKYCATNLVAQTVKSFAQRLDAPDGELVLPHFTYSPFAFVALDAVTYDGLGNMFVAVKQMLENHDVFRQALKEPWMKDFFQLQKEIHGHELSQIASLEDPWQVVDDFDPYAAHLLDQRYSFLRDHNIIFPADDPVTLEW